MNRVSNKLGKGTYPKFNTWDFYKLFFSCFLYLGMDSLPKEKIYRELYEFQNDLQYQHLFEDLKIECDDKGNYSSNLDKFIENGNGFVKRNNGDLKIIVSLERAKNLISIYDSLYIQKMIKMVNQIQDNQKNVFTIKTNAGKVKVLKQNNILSYGKVG